MPVFDQGYQHWNGTLSGHTWRWLTIARHGVQVALQNKFLRFFTLLSMFPALMLVAVLILWGFLEQNADFAKPVMLRLGFPRALLDDPGQFRTIVWTLAFHFFFKVELFAAMILVLLVGPSLISQDLRFNAIPLYFSRPLLRGDYFLGKLGVIGFFLLAASVAPALLGYVLGVLFSFKWSVLNDTWHLVPATVAYGLVIVISAGTLMLALSSLSRSSRYVAAFWIGVWFISSTVSGALSDLHAEATADAAVPMFQGQHRGFVPIGMGQDWERRQVVLIEAHLNDWWPLLSYTANLDRVGRALLGVDGIAERVATDVLPPQMGKATRLSFRYRLSGSQYGWYWSALVLLVLFGASLWLLTTRVRTLDRLS